MFDGMLVGTPFAKYAAQQLIGESFTLIDVGCSGGIDAGWRVFGSRLRAYGFDPNIGECNRLTAAETNPSVRYVPAFVSIPPNHPFAQKKRDQPNLARNPWNRLSVARSIELQAAKLAKSTEEARTQVNQWQTVVLADPSRPIYLEDFLAKNDLFGIDFIKIDVDGPDFEILNSLDAFIRDYPVLGFGLEVNYIGSESETDHTLHNTDRFMRSHGFDLFDLSVRRYSTRALPSPFSRSSTGPSFQGRPLQGDALYLRDIASPDNRSVAEEWSVERLLKLAAVYSLFDLADCAAELLIVFRGRFAEHIDVHKALELLATQSQRDFGTRLPYGRLVSAFENGSRLFYPGRWWPLMAAFRSTMRAARMAWSIGIGLGLRSYLQSLRRRLWKSRA